MPILVNLAQLITHILDIIFLWHDRSFSGRRIFRWYQIKLTMFPLEVSIIDWSPLQVQQKGICISDLIMLIVSCYASLFYCCTCPYYSICSIWLHFVFALFVLKKFDVIHVNSVRLKHIDCSYHSFRWITEGSIFSNKHNFLLIMT